MSPRILFETLDSLSDSVGVMAMHIDAGLDRNGNGRRLWIVFNEDAEAIDVVDGYAGSARVKQLHPEAVLGVTFKVTPKNFRDWERFGESLGRKRGG